MRALRDRARACAADRIGRPRHVERMENNAGKPLGITGRP